MDTSVVVSVIAAASSVIVAAVSFYLTKAKEREADWRKYKFEQYKEFLVSMSGALKRNPTPEGPYEFAKACNTLHLIGSSAVLVALHDLQRELEASPITRSQERHDALLSKLIWEIRQDMRIPGTTEQSEFIVQLKAPRD
jgi:hypothetical protein